MTVKELRAFLSNPGIPDSAEIMFEDGNGTGIPVTGITHETVGAVECVTVSNMDICITC